MKIIDLLNKIANEEEIPKKIKYNNEFFTIRGVKDDYANENSWFTDRFCLLDLNEEVEIIEEEKKIPEKLTPFEAPFLKGEEPDIRFRLIIDRINAICDYLKSKGE